MENNIDIVVAVCGEIVLSQNELTEEEEAEAEDDTEKVQRSRFSFFERGRWW